MRHVTICRIVALIIAIGTVSACAGTKAVVGEGWTAIEVLTQGEGTEFITETVHVHNCCGVVERKSVSCSAGTENEFSLSLGASLGIQAGGKVTIDPHVGTALGFTRGGGETLELDPPPAGSVYQYKITKTYSVISGEALLRSSDGSEKTTTYQFHSNCSLRIEPYRETSACREICPSPSASQPTTIVQFTRQPTAPAISPTSPTYRYCLISLSEVGKPESGNLGLQAGIRTLAGVDFEIGWLVTTQSDGDPNNPETITINLQQHCPNVSEIHFLLQASWALGSNQEFGNIRIIFADGHTVMEPLIVGYNIRDWSAVDRALTAPNAQQAWQGIAWDGQTKGVVDVLTLHIPSDYAQSELRRIEILDESVAKLNSLNPGIHLWAITAEQELTSTITQPAATPRGPVSQATPSSSIQETFTQEAINAILGEGNWFCFPDRLDGVAVKNVPPNFVVDWTLDKVKTAGHRKIG